LVCHPYVLPAFFTFISSQGAGTCGGVSTDEIDGFGIHYLGQVDQGERRGLSAYVRAAFIGSKAMAKRSASVIYLTLPLGRHLIASPCLAPEKYFYWITGVFILVLQLWEREPT